MSDKVEKEVGREVEDGWIKEEESIETRKVVVQKLLE